MPKDIARLEIIKLDPSPAREDKAVSGLVQVTAMMVSRILGFDVH